MTEIIFATGNKDKMREIREIMADCPVEIVSMKEAGIVADIVEDGSTFEENAIIKAKAVYDITGLPVIADDSGLCVEALDGRPGVYSARYAPKGMECEKLLKEMENIPAGKRNAYFQCDIAFINGDTCRVFTGKCSGEISFEARGNNGFGYDPVFLCGERTLAEMSGEEKNKISHRAEALKGLYEYLKQITE